MYLKSIEIQGFKSFANKILFEFHNGITGIVGPNGSGKSNVADAVRWVLGEQRVRQLRGGTMQDVIFSGTEIRKPQGFAYVAITLDNSDHKLPIAYDQVTVSRRLYRSGESEYKINGSACRLKDINELFYDTGIGKEGYSIIGQGQIDKILSGRPEERRELFDEAAGIVKFKKRKLIAQRKLDDEEQNLVRVKDILSELEKQVGPLKLQSEAAKEYLKLKEELKSRDANLFLLEHKALQLQLSELDQKTSIVKGDWENASSQSEQLKKDFDRLEEENSASEEKIASTREEHSKSILLKESIEGQIAVLREQIRSEQLNEENRKERISSIDQELLGKEKQKQEYEKQREETKKQVAQAEQALTQAGQTLSETEQEMARLSKESEAAKAAIISALNEKAGLAAKSQRYETMLEQVDVRRSEVTQKLLRFKSDESVQEEELKKEEKRLEQIQEELDRLTELEEETAFRLTAAEEDGAALAARLSRSQQDYHISHSKLESLKNLAERYEGYGNSIRRVMEQKSRIPGIHGVVADLISTSKKYETAIETALGGSIQNIVTDREETAKELIEYLKKNRYGRATFLPLTGISARGGFTQESALREPGILGLASDLVEVKDEYRTLSQYLLGRVVVADTIDHAIALARKFRHTLRIVTLEGELLSAGGSMTGGSFKNSSNLLGRQRELSELQASCRKALQDVEETQKAIADNSRLKAQCTGEAARLRETKQEIVLRKNTAQMNMERLLGKKQEIAESSADLVMENRELEFQLKEIRENRARLSREEEQLEQLQKEQEARSEQLSRKLSDAQQQKEETAKLLSGAQLTAAGIRQQDRFIAENVSRILKEESSLKEERQRILDGSGESEAVISEKLAKIEQLGRQILEETSKAQRLEEALAQNSEEKERLAEKQKSFFRKREELSEEIGRLDKELYRLESQKERLTERMSDQISYMWEEYELTYSGAQALKDEAPGTIPEIRRAIEELKGNIKGLGNVNVNAIEDYREISERYEFLKSQNDDLAAAREALLKIIEELDTGMRLQFEEKFAQIRQEFDKVFKELFGGGHGALILQEDEDILEAGIQIISQPPGKKLQNMMQLSGGEKALTAIALLFAIQNLKPSPFCLLDEIEAALDDSNVDRFAKYLHKLTKNTQFIVITHRRGTMVSSDRLYGITMQEKGVSTLVSVNLVESELEAQAKAGRTKF
ncbi:MAG: chromosome segregation protein SMC [Clostridium sp.]|nr:chromosome segregation protein SMC [Clostridium sp.]